MLFDDGQLAGQPPVDQGRGNAVKPGKETFRKAEVRFPRIAP
jgi:hypothetical protein